ncbi:hypothetical protein AM493_04560 [Flavobacterium akiainvivens]|uniref:Uncharacterized protein n=1 Tax=Flavobacterium akiainvivens TaxID=1202724 RepID=A0A0M8M9K6_9FLAO|nr:hypothetical protein [Flavobacterium akiainvivens]KOS05385.1 hypothetical protein AM493_04560 [Flavobacterium akiainvivens]SFQ73793.1 hypothetical protein SAMN05444144_11938 [Flavobacterium akiainvivens]
MNLLKFNFIAILFIAFVAKIIAQENQAQVNIILIIDNELVTSGVRLSFVSENNKILLEQKYTAGTALEIDLNWFEDKVYLAFDYIGKADEEYKKYHYRINTLKGYISKTEFLILRIFNLDKPLFKEAYCKAKDEYVFEIENQSYIMQEPQCKEFVKF